MRVKTSQGVIRLDTNRMLGEGGEAKVFPVAGNKALVAKIYHQPTAEKADKLREMLSRPPVDPCAGQGHVSIAWPVDLLFDTNGQTIGFLMPVIKGGYSFAQVYHRGDRKRLLPAGFGYQYLLRTAHNLAVAVAAIHDMGYVIGDLNVQNILVRPDARVTIIDCDSFQIGAHRCDVGVSEYMAPELQGAALNSRLRQVEEDQFTLALLIYLLLLGGRHPFAGIGEPGATEERIRLGLFPYKRGGPKPPLGAPRLDWLPDNLQQLTCLAFVDGHTTPKSRPTANDWASGLTAAEAKLTGCRRDNGHPFFAHSRKCPECQLKQARQRQARKARVGTATQQQRPLRAQRPRTKVQRKRGLGWPLVILVVGVAAYNWPLFEGAEKSRAPIRAAVQHARPTLPIAPRADVRKSDPKVPLQPAKDIYTDSMGRERSTIRQEREFAGRSPRNRVTKNVAEAGKEASGLAAVARPQDTSAHIRYAAELPRPEFETGYEIYERVLSEHARPRNKND